MYRISVHARSRDPKLFFNGINFTAVENDIAVLKVRNPEDLTCTEKHIWPACLPDKVTLHLSTINDIHIHKQ